MLFILLCYAAVSLFSRDAGVARQLAAVESGDLTQINVKSLLGDALQALTDEVTGLGIGLW